MFRNDNYDYRRPVLDNRFKNLGKDNEDSEAGYNGKALNLYQSMDSYEQRFIQYLVNLHNSLRRDTINLDEVQSAFELLKHMTAESEDEYLQTLIKPEMTKGSKIPATIPIPSSSFQLHNSVTISTNSTGNAALIFNPFYLASSGTNSTLLLNNNAALSGSATNDNFIPINIGQVIPAVYNQYRVVSASIVVKYVGRLDIVQGVIGGAIVFDSSLNPASTNPGVAQTSLAKYGDFNLAMDAFYTQENLMLNGIRELYFPLDNTFEQYIPLGTDKKGFNFFVYILNSVPSASYYKVDIYVNYECLPDAAFLNYMPTQTCSRSNENKTESISIVQKRPITMSEEMNSGTSKKQSFWDKIKQTVGGLLPSISSIAQTVFPGAKPLINAIQTMIK